jgi:hypothetical protein
MSEIAERNIRSCTTSGGTTLIVSDYSIPSALHHIAALREVKHRGIYSQMLKDAAALQLLTVNQGVYKTHRN